MIAEYQVLLEIELEHEAPEVAVLRDVRYARLDGLSRRPTGDVAAFEGYGAAGHLAQARQRLDEFGLAVAADSRDPNDLACTYGE